MIIWNCIWIQNYPTASWPRILGKHAGGTLQNKLLLRRWRNTKPRVYTQQIWDEKEGLHTLRFKKVTSLWQREVQMILMRISPDLGGPTITSSITRGSPAFLATAAANHHRRQLFTHTTHTLSYNLTWSQSNLPRHLMGFPAVWLDSGAATSISRMKLGVSWYWFWRGRNMLMVIWLVAGYGETSLASK